MAKRDPHQASPKEDLEQENAVEESMASTVLCALDSDQGVVLKNWSAQDFANIYVRFRPHLIIHAKKFLRDETLAEEVVQDAFLYLLTALPELDSELGILRFLKWKTKMLSLDLIRSSQHRDLRRHWADEETFVAGDDPSEILVRAEDAAIVRLALAKLSPRHREALIATVYEGKTNEQAARAMDLEPNAFRQLLFRARAAFRNALVGEADLNGKSLSEVLTVAARHNSKHLRTFSGALVLVVTSALLGSAPLSGLFTGQQNNVAFPQQTTSAGIPDARPNSGPRPGGLGTETPQSPINSNREFESDQERVRKAIVESDEEGQVVLSGNAADPSSDQQSTDTVVSRDAGSSDIAARQLDAALEGVVENLAPRGEFEVEDHWQTDILSLAVSPDVTLHLGLSLDADKVVQFAFVDISVGDSVLKAVPTNTIEINEIDGEVSFAATDFIVGDYEGPFDFLSSEVTTFSKSKISVQIKLDAGVPRNISLITS